MSRSLAPTKTKLPRGGKRAGAGRPPLDNPATGRIAFRCTPELEQKAQKLAGDEGLSSWARRIFEAVVMRNASAVKASKASAANR